jgi:hypothetical protein
LNRGESRREGLGKILVEKLAYGEVDEGEREFADGLSEAAPEREDAERVGECGDGMVENFI